MAKYQEIADKYMLEIQCGRIAPGTRMPSIRQLAQLHNVSNSTAVTCYQELESRGWISAKPKAGFFAKGLSTSRHSPDFASFNAGISLPTVKLAPSLAQNGPLGTASSPMDDTIARQLNRAMKRAMQQLNSHLTSYPAPAGEPELRQALSMHFSSNGFAFSPQEVVITHGCMSAVKAALESCTKVGDVVAISSPCFNGLITLLAQMNRKILEIPSKPDGIDLAQLEQHMANATIAAGLFCTTHMNPQGITMSPAQKETLASLANRYQIPIIEDDVYIELSYDGRSPLPAKFFDNNGYILWCGSISKTLAAGLRVGWCLPGRYYDKMVQHFSAGSYGVSSPTQHAIAEIINSGHYNKSLIRKRLDLVQRCHEYRQYLEARLPASIKFSQPQGGLVLWMQIPKEYSQRCLQEIKQSQLDIRAGELFTTRDLYCDMVRLNIGHPLSENVIKHLNRLISIINQQNLKTQPII
ncbi:PLP-dependent aminotransferase family protein [Thaumasiovibrio subtropicus]|uniref:aminotransferase-like domain-containing protein n=1 Tax=Thaumasiovibrio subtropicus TaxID=1891207 RepID=UPI000B34F4E3|nr:PLP-dependent aminotransferase family protein [Thaumasiovibrio subtropicus]